MAKPKKTVTPPYDGYPFIVIAKKAMMRGGRAWTTGVHDFTSEEKRKAAGLEDDEATDAMLRGLANYPADFEVKGPQSAPEEKK